MMATLSHLPPTHFISSRKLLSTTFPLRNYKFYSHSHQNHHRICASLTKKPRANRKLKSDEDLRKDIEEFLSTFGLPQDHVPSTKELSGQGRQDLANIVRRRGYKFIKELLAAPAEAEINASIRKENLTENHENEKVKDMGEDVTLSSEATEVKEMEDMAESESISSEVNEVDEKTIHLDEDASLPSEATTSEDIETIAEISRNLDSDKRNSTGQETSIYLSLQEKVARFIQDGELDEIEDSTGIIESQDDIESGSCHGAHGNVFFSDASGADLLNGPIISSSHDVEHQAWEINASRSDNIATEEVIMVNKNEDLDVKHAQNVDNQVEISRLKLMLHHQELELTQLKEQIEKEKLALSILQTKAEKEISKAQKLISEKDAELHTAEESLSGLKEVEIQYWGEGEIVEVAGSFNGWHQRIRMDLQPSSSISDPIGSRCGSRIFYFHW